jgi:integrase
LRKRFAFSRASLVALPLPERGWVNVYDDSSRGLALGIGPTGVKSFLVYRKFKGRPVKIILGSFDPHIPETREIPAGSEPLDLLGQKPSLNVRMARKIATAVNAQLDSGVNPTVAVRKARAELTFGQLFERYCSHLQSEGKKSRQQFIWIFERYLGDLPDSPKKRNGRKRTKSEGAVNWQRRPLSEITNAQVEKLRFDLAVHIGHTTSNRVIELVRSIYAFGIKRRLHAGENPARGIGKFKSKSRERFLQSDELPKFFRSLETEPGQDIRDFFYLALYTGARRGNLLGMRWEQFNFDSAAWRIPETKSGEPLTVPLVEESLQILKRRAKHAQSVEWVFPGRGKSGHLAGVSKAWRRVLKRAGLHGLRIHDLRRSLGSWMASTGASMVMTQRALGHKTITASLIYQRLAQDPVRAAMQRAASELIRASQKTAEVIEITEAASGTEG